MSRAYVTAVPLVWLLVLTSLYSAAAGEDSWDAPLTRADGKIVMRVVMVQDEDEDPAAAGKAAAESLQQAMQAAPLKAVIISECFEDKEYKEKLLQGVGSVLGRDILFGGATYGSFTQQGCTDFDSVCLLGIGGEGIGVSAVLQENLGTAQLSVDEHEAQVKQKLHAAGTALGKKLHRRDSDKLLVLIPDAHSPKNRYLVEGVQQVIGTRFPMTGGSVNKNAGQTFVYFRGQMYQDSAVALMLSGGFSVTLSGRLAKENAAVIRTAREGAAEALGKHTDSPVAVLAYNCAGRRGKLDDVEEELVAIQKVIGKQVPLFGCYNAGEIGPLDPVERRSDALCGGSGWHVMFTMIWKDD